MDYPTLLLQLENQLQYLHKKGLNYINIEAMPRVKLKLLVEGLGEMMSTETEITVKHEGANHKLSEQTQPVQKINDERNHTGVYPPSTGISAFKEDYSSAIKQTVTEAFAQITPLLRYSCLHLGSLHPRILSYKLSGLFHFN